MCQLGNVFIFFFTIAIKHKRNKEQQTQKEKYEDFEFHLENNQKNLEDINFNLTYPFDTPTTIGL